MLTFQDVLPLLTSEGKSSDTNYKAGVAITCGARPDVSFSVDGKEVDRRQVNLLKHVVPSITRPALQLRKSAIANASSAICPDRRSGSRVGTSGTD